MDKQLNESEITDTLSTGQTSAMDSVDTNVWTQSIDQKSGDHQIPYLSTDVSGYGQYVVGHQSQDTQNVVNYEDYATNGQYFNNFYANYYQHFSGKSDYSATDPALAGHSEKDSNPHTIDLINKALAKQKAKSCADAVRDEDEEEGQIPSSPRFVGKESIRSNSRSTPFDSTRNSPFNSSNSMSRSRSPSKERHTKSRSRSPSRKRYVSRSRSRSRSRRRRRTRSRSRSPYFGPIIKDYRRGRRGFVRYPRGFRDRGNRFSRRGHNPHFNSFGVSRRHEYSRSRSPSFSPKRRHIDINKSDNNSDEEKTIDSKLSETLKPSDINMSEKRLTQSFLAMLEERQNRSKMVPIDNVRSETSETDEYNRQHGFVNTFTNTTAREKEGRINTLSYDLEREGWQVIDDANSESGHKGRHDSSFDSKYDGRYLSENKDYLKSEKSGQKDMDVESTSSEDKNSKRKKSRKHKKRKKRKTSTSSDSSGSESDNENADEVESNDKKKSKKNKKSKKKKKKVSTSSSSSETEDKERLKKKKNKKKKKKTKRSSESDSESPDKTQDNENSVLISNTITETNDSVEKAVSVVNEVVKDVVKTKDKKKKKRKTKSSDSSDSDSEVEKKKKKKNKKKKSKKRKHRSSSSSSSSDSSDSSESMDRKKKKKKKSKKKKTKKQKRDKKSEKKEKSKQCNEEKKKPKEEDSEFVTVVSVGEPVLELKWPKKMIKYTACEPSLAYSINPKIKVSSDDLKQMKNTFVEEFERKQNTEDMKDSQQLATEYERFIDELNPIAESHGLSHVTIDLESKLRDKLVKQLSDKKDSESQELVTPSERRAMEKMKKNLHSYEGSDENRRLEDLKSAPMSAYYSAKVQKSSPNDKSVETEKSDSKHNKTLDKDNYRKTSEIAISIGDHSLKPDSEGIENFRIDDKKKTARELLERVKQRKHSNRDEKDGKSSDKSESQKSKRLPQTGKIPPKKSFAKTRDLSVTTANADSTQHLKSNPMKLDMNYDYNWYYNYYMNSMYGIAQYPQLTDPNLASAYYAQYSMVTSYDYNQTDLTNWMSQKGFTFDSSVVPEDTTNPKPSEQSLSEDTLKPSEVQSFVESSAPDVCPVIDSETKTEIKETNDLSEGNAEQVVKPEESEEIKNKTIETMDNKIEVLISSTKTDISLDELNTNELKTESSDISSDMSPFSSSKITHKVKVRVTANSQPDVDIFNGNSPPPPPPPPPRPVMTTFTSAEPQTLPNGQVIPAGSKQIVVHPYQTGDLNKFTSEWFSSALNPSQTETQNNP